MKKSANGTNGKLIPRREDIGAQILTLRRRKAELKALIREEGKQGGVFYGFKRLAPALLEVLEDMEPLDNLRTASEDRKRRDIFDDIVRVMDRHIRLQNRIVIRSKKGQ
jgi:hypothetical protein